MKKTLLTIISSAAIPLLAGPWIVDTPEPGTTVLRNENGKFSGSKSILYMAANGLRLKKTFDLSKLPEGTIANAKSAKLRVYCNITDYHWGKNKEPQALNESISFTINGNTLICKTSDARFPRKKTVKDPQHYRWVDVEFPIAWIKNGKMEVVIFKRSPLGGNDFFYQAVDITSETTHSAVSTNGGATFGNAGCIKGGKGEGMVRLVLSDKGEDVSGVPGSDFSTDRDITKLRPLFVFNGAKAGKNTIIFTGNPGNKFVLPGSGSFNYTGYGMTLSGIFRFAPSANKNMTFFHKPNAFYLIRKDDKFVLGISSAPRKWQEFELGGDMPADNRFFHIAAVFKPEKSGCRVTLYIDGVMADERELAGVTIPANKNGISVGAGVAGFDFNGELAEVSVFHRVLSDTDILNITENFPILKQK